MFESGKIYAQAPDSDSLPAITITSTDTISLRKSPQKNTVLDEIIKTTSSDSVVYDLTNKKIIMLNKCVIDYGTIHLETGYAEMDLTTNLLIAKGLPDSVGNITQKPV